MRVHVCVGRITKVDTANSDILCWLLLCSLYVDERFKLGHHKQCVTGWFGSSCIIVPQVQDLGVFIVEPFVRWVELFHHILNVKLITIVVSASTLKTTFAEGEIPSLWVIVSNLKHPTCPVCRSPGLDHGSFRVFVWLVGEHRLVCYHSRGHTIGKSTTSLSLVPTPVARRWIKVLTWPSNTQLIFLKHVRWISKRRIWINFLIWHGRKSWWYPLVCF